MTLPANPRKSEVAIGDGVSVLVPFEFKVSTAGEVQVVQTTAAGITTTLVQDSDYTITLNPDQNNAPGGTITLAVPAALNVRTVALGNVDYGQPFQVPNAGNYKPELHEGSFDRIVTQIQQLRELIGRGVVSSATDEGELIMPSQAARLGKFLAFDATTGDLIAASGVSGVPVSAFMATVLDDLTAAAARATLGVTPANLGVTPADLGAGATGASIFQAATPAAAAAILLPSLALPRGYIDGLTLSTAGASTTMSIAPGQAVDSTGAVAMSLAASMAKTTGAWAVGSAQGGKLSAAAIANATWYYWFEIRRPDTGVVDIGFDVSPTTPTLPANYTQFRYIGASLTNGSAQWTKFVQDGDNFTWDVAVADTSVSNLATQTSYVQTIPRGRVMTWVGSILWAGAANPSIIVGSPLQTLPSPSPTNGDLFSPVAGGSVSTMARISTNTSAQIAARADTASTTFRSRTHGWIDQRGRNE